MTFFNDTFFSFNTSIVKKDDCNEFAPASIGEAGFHDLAKVFTFSYFVLFCFIYLSLSLSLYIYIYIVD